MCGSNKWWILIFDGIQHSKLTCARHIIIDLTKLYNIPLISYGVTCRWLISLTSGLQDHNIKHWILINDFLLENTYVSHSSHIFAEWGTNAARIHNPYYHYFCNEGIRGTHLQKYQFSSEALIILYSD